MKTTFKLMLAIFISFNTFNAQTIKIYGNIKAFNKFIENVNVYLLENDGHKISNKNGYYEFEIDKLGNYAIQFSHIGFKNLTKKIEVNSFKDIELNISLEPNDLNIGEVVVSSSKNDKLLKESIIPIEYTSQTKIETSNALTISDLVSKNAGINLITDAPWATTINIRGLSKQNLVYMIDGNRIETSTNLSAGLSLIDLNNTENIEIVKGGISSLYGSGATGGIINIKSKEPKYGNNFFINPRLSTSYNSANKNFNNSLSLNTGGQYWSFLISGLYRDADNVRTPNGTMENSSFQDESLNGKLKLMPIHNVEVDLTYSKYSAYDVGLPGGDPFPETTTAKYIYAKRELYSGEVNFYNLSNYSLRTQLKYYHQKIDRNVEVRPNANAVSNPNAQHSMDGLSIQNNWLITDNNNLITGIDYWQRKYEGIRTTTNKKANIITVDKPVPDSKFANLGFFASDEIYLFENDLALSLGGRYDLIKISNEETKNPLYVINNGVTNTNTRNNDASYSAYDEKNNSFSGSLGLLYKVMHNWDFTFNSAYTFRSPSLEERYQYIDLGGIKYFGNPNLKPEKGISLDAGFRVWNDDFHFRLNTFLNDLSNLVIDKEVAPDSLYKKDNVGKAELYGFDLSSEYIFYKNNYLYATASYVIGKDKTEDSYLPQIPPLTLNLGVNYKFIDEIIFDLSMRIVSDQNKISFDEKRTGGYTTFDLRLNSDQYYILKTYFQLIIGVDNIFDKAYRNHLSTFRGVNLIEPGRNLFAKINIEFR